MKWLKLLHGMVWGPWTLLIFLGTGLFLTVKCRFFSSEDFPSGGMPPPEASSGGKNNATNERTPDEGSRKPSASSSLYARPWLLPLEQEILPVLLLHLLPEAPAPLFWMWVSAFIGMITAYGETCLGIRFRLPRTGRPLPVRPLFYMEHGLNVPLWPFSTAYSALCAPLAWGAWSRRTLLLLPCPLPLTFLSGSRLCFTLPYRSRHPGGIRSIGRTAERLVPAAAAIYVLFSLTVILSSLPVLPGVLKDIFDSAFIYGLPQEEQEAFISRSVRYGTC